MLVGYINFKLFYEKLVCGIFFELPKDLLSITDSLACKIVTAEQFLHILKPYSDRDG